MFSIGYKKRYERTLVLCEHQAQEIERLKKEKLLLAGENNDLKSQVKEMTLHIASLGLINGCLMDVVTEEQKVVVGNKIKIKEGKAKKGAKHDKKSK